MSNLYSIHDELPPELADDVLEDDVPTGPPDDDDTATDDDE